MEFDGDNNFINSYKEFGRSNDATNCDGVGLSMTRPTQMFLHPDQTNLYITGYSDCWSSAPGTIRTGWLMKYNLLGEFLDGEITYEDSST